MSGRRRSPTAAYFAVFVGLGLASAALGPSLDVLRARVGVSLGAASYPNYGETFDQLVASADKAMYLTKAAHKKRSAGGRDEVPVQAMAASASASRWNPLEPGIIEDGGQGIEIDLSEALIVEIDESHIVASAAVN